ncbi:BQ2448_6292 [Microbotryum intermedium]|uniref:BQ2448_6292 protein n=1 Tax=Microbotryum intermedium TaxID=269621 RepID=A0A238FJA3_9BASI|nr:BQ2448_6292 [Microbotryum intermedium]
MCLSDALESLPHLAIGCPIARRLRAAVSPSLHPVFGNFVCPLASRSERRIVELRILFFQSIRKLSRRCRFSSQPLEPITETEFEELRGSIQGCAGRLASLRIEGYECCICPEFSGKRWSPALALRHFRTIEHWRKARTRRSALLDESQTGDAIVSDATNWQAIDDVRPIGGMFSNSEDEAVHQREQWTPDHLLDVQQHVDDLVGDSHAMAPRFCDDDLDDLAPWEPVD